MEQHEDQGRWSGRALMNIPARGRELIRRIPEPVKLEMRRLSRRSLILGFEIFAGFLVIGLVAVMLIHQRLSQGPVSLSFLVAPIESAINRELDGLTVRIDDAIVRRDPEGSGVRFRLRNLRLIDDQNNVVAQAPQAAIGLSSRALLAGRIAPGRVDLIGPRMLLYYTPDIGLALTFSRPTGKGTSESAIVPAISAGGERAFTKRLGDSIAAAKAQQINLVQATYKALRRARKRKSASSYLANFGMRGAMVVFDHAGKQNFWRVPNISINLTHRQKRSIISGEATISSSQGNWSFGFRTEQSQKEKRLNFTALFTDLVPTGLAADIPALAVLKALDMPVNGRIDLGLSRTGNLLSAEAKFVMSAGHIKVPWTDEGSMLVDEGVLQVRYDRAKSRVLVLPSSLQWGESRVTISGEMHAEHAAEGAEKSWVFALKAHDGAFAAEEFGVSAVPLDAWTAKGRILPNQGRLELESMSLQMAGSLVELSGSVTEGPGSPEITLNGQLGAMSVDLLKRIWPRFLTPGARDWVGSRVTGGQIHGGQVRVRVPAGLLARINEGADIPDEALAFDMPLSNVEVHYIEGLPPIQTEEARIRILGRRMVFDVPKARIVLPTGQTIQVSEGQFVINDLLPDPPTGEVVFTALTLMPAALEFLDLERLGYIKAVGFKPTKTAGDVSAKFRITMPLLKDLEFKDLQMAGEVKLRKVKFDRLFDTITVSGGSLDFGITEKAIDAQGELYLNGVPTKVAWQRIFAASAEKQPPLRLYGVFDGAARRQLGFNVNHMIVGEIPVEITMRPGPSGAMKTHLHADVGNGELVLTNVGWRKSRGRAAVIDFDIVNSGNGRTALENFKITGDDIAIDGWIAIDENNQITEFHFPKFSLNVITQLDISGKRSNKKLWEVEAKGETYDGRQLFRSLFSAGQLTEKKLPPSQFQGGFRLHAEIGTVVGYSGTTLKKVRVDIVKRRGKLVKVEASGRLNGRKPVGVQLLEKAGKPRELRAHAEDAGDAFRLIGFYPSIEGGEAKLSVDLDGRGAAEKTGTLWVRDFNILGDPVVREVLANSFPEGGPAFEESTRRRRGKKVKRQRIFFDYMQVPFSVGLGEFVFHDSIIKGPALGATMRGQVNFKHKTIYLSGTYSPLYGLNSVPGQLPIIGPLFGGSRGEGLIGITFSVQGKMESPQVIVNPVSMVVPGFLRQLLFDSIRPPAKISPRSEEGARGKRRASSVNRRH